jgi:hypothetical protein
MLYLALRDTLCVDADALGFIALANGRKLTMAYPIETWARESKPTNLLDVVLAVGAALKADGPEAPAKLREARSAVEALLAALARAERRS